MTTLDLINVNPNTNFNALLFLVKEATVQKKKNNELYISAVLENKTGTIKAVSWDPVTEETKSAFKAGNVLSVSGTIAIYMGTTQMNITGYQTVDPNTVDMSELVKEAPYPADKLYPVIEAQVQAFQNNDYKAIVSALLEKHRELFKTHPAAKRIHHGYKGGLLYHTCSILKMSESLVALHGPYVDRELLAAGIILHDLGKITEYTSYIGTDVTLEGRLKGHISIMSEEIGKMADTLTIQDPTNVLKLQHMILSHHGQAQNGWGSTVSPQLIEAHILHKLDSLDAEMDAYRNGIEQTNINTFSAPIFGINNSKFYKHVEN